MGFTTKARKATISGQVLRLFAAIPDRAAPRRFTHRQPSRPDEPGRGIPAHPEDSLYPDSRREAHEGRRNRPRAAALRVLRAFVVRIRFRMTLG